MKPLYIKKNGQVEKVTGAFAMPATYPAERVAYDNTNSGLEADDAQGAIDEIVSDLDDKVDKETGKGLSTNDYTTNDKNKLAGIAAGATKTASSTTNGNIKINDVETQVYDDSEIQDKIDETTTSISGNPISISGLKSNQLAKDPIITLEPIQAGSGTPSPVNQRPISGYDKIEVLSCGKNIAYNLIAKPSGSYNPSVVKGENTYTFSGSGAIFITEQVKAGKTYVLSYTITSGSFSNVRVYDDLDSTTIIVSSVSNGVAFTPSADGYIRFWIASDVVISNLQLEMASSATTYEEPHKTTSISESLGQTVYGLTHEVRTGKAKVTFKAVDMGDLDYYRVSDNVFTVTISDKKSGSGRMYCSCFDYEVNKGYALDSDCISDSNASGYATTVFIKTTASYSSSALLKTAVTGQTLVYTLATPTEIQLTPHEISLLSNYAYVSTNGTNIALDYHNGELASLSDVAQVGETVNELGEYVKGVEDLSKKYYVEYTPLTDGVTVDENSSYRIGNMVFISLKLTSNTTVSSAKRLGRIINTSPKTYKPFVAVGQLGNTFGGVIVNCSLDTTGDIYVDYNGVTFDKIYINMSYVI